MYNPHKISKISNLLNSITTQLDHRNIKTQGITIVISLLYWAR